jgi:hypothetical protein
VSFRNFLISATSAAVGALALIGVAFSLMSDLV